jgi:hypothetical protein
VTVDVIIEWYAAAGFGNALAAFRNAPRVISYAKQSCGDGCDPYAQALKALWPYPVRGILQHNGIDPKVVDRVCVIGFSQGVQGVNAILASKDAAFVDTAIAIDGIHGKNLNWAKFARLAKSGITDVAGIKGQRNCIITHNATIPPYMSTTESAKYILDEVYGAGNWPKDGAPECMPYQVSPPFVATGNKWNANKITQYDYPNIKYQHHDGGLHVVGFNNSDPSGVNDHIFQAHWVTPEIVLKCLLAPRWNDNDPKASPGCTREQLTEVGSRCQIPLPQVRFPDTQTADGSLGDVAGMGPQAGAQDEPGMLTSLLVGGAAAAAGYGAYRLGKSRKWW